MGEDGSQFFDASEEVATRAQQLLGLNRTEASKVFTTFLRDEEGLAFLDRCIALGHVPEDITLDVALMEGRVEMRDIAEGACISREGSWNHRVWQLAVATESGDAASIKAAQRRVREMHAVWESPST